MAKLRRWRDVGPDQIRDQETEAGNGAEVAGSPLPSGGQTVRGRFKKETPGSSTSLVIVPDTVQAELRFSHALRFTQTHPHLRFL